MDDRSLVTALRSGDSRGFAGVYDAYADRLLAYAVTMLRDRDAAADAVHDALLIARERIGQLRDPDRLRPWLYAIVRNECLRQLRDRRRAAPLDEAGEVIDESAGDLGAGARAAELRELVWSAAAALNPGEREVLELSVRHGLEGPDLAAALGTGLNQAHALNSRARAQLERSLGALLVARANSGECADLNALLLGWDGTLTPLLRKRLVRHADKCELCGETRRHRLSPVALLAGVPFVIAPPALRDRVLGDLRLVSDESTATGGTDRTDRTGKTGETGEKDGTGKRKRAAAAATAAAKLAERAGPWLADGFPRPLDRRRRGGGLWLTSAAAAVVVALLLMLGWTLRPESEPTALAGTGTATETTATGGGILPTPAETVDVVDPTATAAPNTTATPAPTTTAVAGTTAAPTTTAAAPVDPPTPTRAVPTTPPRTPPPTTTRAPSTSPPARAPTVTLGATELRADCVKQVWTVRLTATVTGAVASGVTASWTLPRGQGGSAAMTAGPGGTWTTVVTLPTGLDVPARAVAATPVGSVGSGTTTLNRACRRG